MVKVEWVFVPGVSLFCLCRKRGTLLPSTYCNYCSDRRRRSAFHRRPLLAAKESDLEITSVRNICIGAARGLNYLHTGTHQCRTQECEEHKHSVERELGSQNFRFWIVQNECHEPFLQLR